MTRSKKSIKRHYDVETELANRLISASPDERRKLYISIYDELFQRVPDHPQLKVDHEQRIKILQQNFETIRHFIKPGNTFMEIGAGDAALSLMIAGLAKKVIALDVTKSLVTGVKLPQNMEFKEFDGLNVPVETGTIDLAYSHQLMEHLHPDDAVVQLKSIYESLSDGGMYICITPSRLYGPHDVSKFFDETAVGLHLKEYTYTELLQIFREAGFKRFQTFFPAARAIVRWPLFIPRLIEGMLNGVSRKKRMKIINFLPVKILLAGSNLRLVAIK